MSEALRLAWNDVAERYERYFTPRFRPFIDDALAVLPPTLVDGPLAVTCCGPGVEVRLLAERFPGRLVVGIDLSEGMLALAETRCSGLALVRLIRADAADVAPALARVGVGPGALAALVSVFGLQQMAAPAAALGAWVAALAPGGVASVMFWPHHADDGGPFARLRALAAARVPPPSRAWEEELVLAVNDAGAVVERDAGVVHGMEHRSARAFFEAMRDAGPWRALALRVGDALVDEIGEAFVASYDEGVLAHRARARHIVARKQGGHACCSTRPAEETMPKKKKSNIKNKKRYAGSKKKATSKTRAARIANSPGATTRGGKKTRSKKSSTSRSMGATTAQKKAAGKKGGTASARKRKSSRRS